MFESKVFVLGSSLLSSFLLRTNCLSQSQHSTQQYSRILYRICTKDILMMFLIGLYFYCNCNLIIFHDEHKDYLLNQLLQRLVIVLLFKRTTTHSELTKSYFLHQKVCCLLWDRDLFRTNNNF